MNDYTKPESSKKGARKDPEAAPSCTYSPPIVPGLCSENRRFAGRSAFWAFRVEKLCNMLPMSVHWPIVWVTAFVIVYFFLMDCRLYQTLQQWTGPRVNATWTHYSPFRPLTMKLLMMNHGNHYVLMPLAEYFDQYSRFSKRFPFITANMVSVSHIIVCIISFRMMYSDNINVRRWGCVVFQVRNWLDAFDGVVHRSHANAAFKLKSYRNTSGYLVDAFADTWSGFMESLAMYLFFLKNPPTNGAARIHILPWTKPTENGRSRKEFTKWELFRPCLVYGLLVAFSGIFWDRYISHYNEIMEYIPQNALQKEQQLVQLKTIRMWVFIWIWRVVNAQALLDMGLISVVLDKTWPFLHIMQYIGWPFLIILCMATEIQLAELLNSGHEASPRDIPRDLQSNIESRLPKPIKFVRGLLYYIARVTVTSYLVQFGFPGVAYSQSFVVLQQDDVWPKVER